MPRVLRLALQKRTRGNCALRACDKKVGNLNLLTNDPNLLPTSSPLGGGWEVEWINSGIRFRFSAAVALSPFAAFEALFSNFNTLYHLTLYTVQRAIMHFLHFLYT